MGSVDVERGTKPKAYNNYNNNNGIYYVETSEKQWTSWLVPMIVVANVVVFIVVMSVNNCPHNKSGFEGSCVARPWRAIPLFGPSSTLEKLGALEWNKVVHDHQAWRLISCMWLHTGLIHLLGNMLSLVCLGISLEQQFGFVRVGIVYLLSGFGGSILSALFIQSNIFVGASGAVFGLLGAMLSELLTNWTIHSNKIAELWLLVSISAINLGVGILPHVYNFAQIGGFFTGFLLGFVLLLRPQFGWAEGQNLPAGACIKHKHKAYQYTFFIIALILLIVGFMVGLVMLFRGEN